MAPHPLAAAIALADPLHDIAASHARPLAAQEVPWTDVPGVKILGALLGTALLIAAIRSMFGGKGR